MGKEVLPSVILAGFGGSGALQLTLETQQYAVRAGRVFSLGLPSALSQLLHRQSVDVRELDREFDAEDFPGSYARVAQIVLATAAKDPPAFFLSPGSPLFLNAISRYILVEAKKSGLSVLTLPGVSAVDAVVANLGIDVGNAGLQVLGARGFVARPDVANPRMPLLLLEPAAVGPPFSGDGWTALVEALRERYPEVQPVTVLKPAGAGLSRVTATLSRFEEIAGEVDASASLFVDLARGEAAVSNGKGPGTRDGDN